MFPITLRRWGSLGLMIVLSLALPARATAVWQDLGNQLPAGRQPDPQIGAGAAESPSAGSTLEQEIRLIADRFAGWQQAGAGQKIGRLDDHLRAHWVMVDDNGLLTGRILVDPQKLQQAFSEASSPPAFQQFAESNLPASNCNCNGGGGAGYPQAGNWGLNAGYDYGRQTQNIGYYRNPENPSAGHVPMQVFLLNRGKLIAMDEVDTEGRFQFQGIKPGSYSLLGYGLTGFFAFGLNILSYADNANVPTEILATPINLIGPPITGWVKRAAPAVRFRIRGQHRFGQGRDDPPRLYGLDGLQTFMPAAAPATSLGGQPTALTPDGRLLGRLHYINSFDGRPADLQTTGVQLIRDGRMVMQTATDNYGVFEFRDIEPGTYGVLAVGPDGIGALQITVADAPSAAALPIDLALLDDTSTGFVNHFMTETAYWAGLSPPSPSEKKDEDCGCNGGMNLQGGTGCPLTDLFRPSGP